MIFLLGFLERTYHWALSLTLGHSSICNPPASFYTRVCEWQQSLRPLSLALQNILSISGMYWGDGHSYKLRIICVKVFNFNKVNICVIIISVLVYQ